MSFLFPAEVDVFRARGLLPEDGEVPAEIMKELYPDMILDRYVRLVCMEWSQTVGMDFANMVAQFTFAHTLSTVRGSQPEKFLDFLSSLPIYGSTLPMLDKWVDANYSLFEATIKKHPTSHNLRLGLVSGQMTTAVYSFSGHTGYQFITAENGQHDEKVRVTPQDWREKKGTRSSPGVEVRDDFSSMCKGLLWASLLPVLTTENLIAPSQLKKCQQEAAEIAAAVDTQFKNITLKSLVDNKQLTS